MNIRIYPGKASGRLKVPTSKSMAHRLLICAGMSEGVSTVHGISDCEDVQATLDCLRAVGASCSQEGDTVTVHGVDFSKACPVNVLPCRESGSTLRFLIPCLLKTGREATFTGYGRLMERPMTVYETLCRERGLLFRQGNGSLTVGGGLPSGEYTLSGNVSSQFVSGLLFALPLGEKDSRIHLIPPIESRSYILMTLDAMRAFGVTAEFESEACIRIPGNQRYCPREVTVEGDYSNAAFPDALNILGGTVELLGLNPNSLQGDRCYRDAMEALSEGNATVSLKDCPDLGPILFALAAAKHGGRFTDTARLRIKESDRVAAMEEELGKLGASVIAVDNGTVEIQQGSLHPPTVPVSGHNDHRIVMAMAILLTLTGGVIQGAEAVRKSYPAFFEDLRRLGITAEEL